MRKVRKRTRWCHSEEEIVLDARSRYGHLIKREVGKKPFPSADVVLSLRPILRDGTTWHETGKWKATNTVGGRTNIEINMTVSLFLFLYHFLFFSLFFSLSFFLLIVCRCEPQTGPKDAMSDCVQGGYDRRWEEWQVVNKSDHYLPTHNQQPVFPTSSIAYKYIHLFIYLQYIRKEK